MKGKHFIKWLVTLPFKLAEPNTVSEGERMSYKDLMNKHDECIQKATKTEGNLTKQFLVRAAEGFKTKAESMKLKEVKDGRRKEND